MKEGQKHVYLFGMLKLTVLGCQLCSLWQCIKEKKIWAHVNVIKI